MSFIDSLFGSDDNKNFKYVEDLINQSSNITLDANINFKWSDKRKYGLDGIKITADDIIIDGNGFTIDGDEKTSIFTITGKNITLKNINFKNAKCAIINQGSLTVKNCTFEDNIANDGNDRDISNEEKLVLNNNHFKSDSKTILNNGIIYLEESTKDPLNVITTDGEIYRRKPIEDNQYDFNHLKELVANNSEILLNQDIIFNAFTAKDNLAVSVKKDDMVIDGNGHIIDAKNKSQGIFHITGDNVIIKNFIFKNSPVNAISNEGSNLKLINCYFKHMDSELDGAISNKGEMYILNSKFKSNFSHKSAAAIYNEGVMYISNARFLNNHSIESGGAIRNVGEIYISNSRFTDNTSKKSGSVLSNAGKAKFGSCIIINNSSDDSGSTIADFNGRIDFIDTTFSYNRQPNAVIFSSPDSHIELIMCKVLDNMCDFSIINNHCALKLEESEFRSNIGKCIIYNAENVNYHQKEKKSFLDITDVEFKDNRVDDSVIYNDDKTCEIKGTLFENNVSTNGDYANIHNLGEIQFKDSKFSEDEISILNEGTIFLNESDSGIEKITNNKGSIQ